MRKHIIVVILLLAGIASSAQEWVDSLRTLNGVEVTSQRAQRSAVSTAPLRTIDRDAMITTGVTSVSDAIHRLPGVTLRDYGGAGGLKTVSVRGFSAGHTGVIFDGIPLSDAQSGQVDISRYSIDNIAAISMTIGDNDDIFIPARASASAASLSISSLPADDKTELTTQLRVGSFGFINPFLRAGGALSDKVTANFVGEFTHADNNYPFKLVNGDATTIERRSNSRMNTGHCEANVRWRATDATTLTGKIYYYDNSRRLPGPVLYYINQNNERLSERNAFSQLRLNTSLSEQLLLMVNAKYNFAYSRYRDIDQKYPGGERNQAYWQREYYASASLLYLPTQPLAIDYSADYFFNNLNSNLPSDNRPRRNSLLQSLTGRYRSGRFTAMARVLYSLYLNSAANGDAAKNANRLSPSLSLSVQPLAGQMLFVRASYKNIFRAPSFSEAYFDHYGSKDIKPESTDQINVGLTYTPRASRLFPSATFTVDGYINHIKDMIVAVPYNMFLWNMVNLGKVRAIGVDVTATCTAAAAWRHSITLTASYGFQRAMPRTNPEASDWMKQVAYIPKHSASISLGYENPWANLTVYGNGVSCRYATNNNLPQTRIDGYVELGARLWRKFSIGSHSIEARVDGLNLLNKQYQIVARYPMPGRSWQATLAFNL